MSVAQWGRSVVSRVFCNMIGPWFCGEAGPRFAAVAFAVGER